MRPSLAASLAVAFTLAATASAAATGNPDSTSVVSIGSSLGFDVLAQKGSTLTVLSSTPVSPLLPPLSEPGLRVGVVLPGRRGELAVNVTTQIFAAEGASLSALGGSFEGNYCLGRDWRGTPYVGAHVGFSQIGSEGSSASTTELGLQLGARHVVGGGSGNGTVRVELRAGVVNAGHGESMSRFGARVGYDLWLQ